MKKEIFYLIGAVVVRCWCCWQYRWETPILEIIFRFMVGWTPRAMYCLCRAR